MATTLTQFEIKDPVLRGHVVKGLESLRAEFAGIFSAETIERFGVDVVEGPQPPSLRVDDARFAQHLEVMRDGRLADVKQRSQLADADLAGVLSEHVDELEPDRVAERLGDRRHTLGLVSLDIGVDDRLAARLAGRALLLGSELQIDGHQCTFID